MLLDHPTAGPAAIRTQLSRNFCLVGTEPFEMAGDVAVARQWREDVATERTGLRARPNCWRCLQNSGARPRSGPGRDYPIITIQEAGLDGFWLHRALQQEGIESHVVDAASIATPRRRRRAKTDKVDGEALLRVLLAYKRGEPRVCAMVVAPSPEEEDRRRVCRERQTLLNERVVHTNRIKGLLFAQGISRLRAAAARPAQAARGAADRRRTAPCPQT